MKCMGFTLIELLIVVAIIGIIAAIAIPNLLNAINRGRQKRTMADMRSIATAVETYSVDNGYVPNTAASGTVNTLLEAYLQPTYIPPACPTCTAGRPASTGSGRPRSTPSSATVLTATSSLVATMFTRLQFDCDICYSNGQFTQWPEGTQQ